MTAMDLDGDDDDAAPALAHPKWLRHIAETNEITQPYKPEKGALLKLGQFKIAQEIGKGGYGRVYLARDNQLQRNVAIKVIDEKFYMREQYAARIPHKNIVQFYESFSEQGSRCLVLEYIPGQSLARWFSLNRVPPLEQAVLIAADIAMALVAMHEANVAHRDLTASNVILTKDNQVKVIDFGIAVFEATHRLEDLETTGAKKAIRSGTCGTPGFAAPEQMGIGEAVFGDPRQGDLWSLGVLLFLLVTGRLPFKEIHVDTYTDTLRSHAKADRAAPRLSELVPEVPSALDRLVARLLSFDPSVRGTAESASFTLQEIYKGLVHPEYETSLNYEGNPFRALCAFGPGDAEIFHERGKETKALLALVKKNRLALLQGDSGVGKSSLIQAGLRPRIWQEMLWLEVAPGRDPDRSPLETVRKAAAQALEQRQQASEEETLDGMLATLAKHLRKPVLLVLDQFEEIFQRPDRATMENDARMFGHALASVVDRPVIDLHVLIVIRTDHYHYLHRIMDMLPISTDDGEVLRALEPRSTKRSMSHLLERTGLDVAHTVLDDVIAAVSTRNEVNAVELQLVLHHVYEYASTLENTFVDRLSLTAMGGPKGVLDERLEAVELRLSENSIPIVRQIMASLVGQEGVRKPGLSILAIAREAGIDEDLVRKVVQVLRKERILTVDGTSGDGALSFRLTCDRLARTVWSEEREFISQREFLLSCMHDAPVGMWRGFWWFGRQSVEKRERMLLGFGAYASRASQAQRDFVEKVGKWENDLDTKDVIVFFGVIIGLVVVAAVVLTKVILKTEREKDRLNAEQSRQSEIQETEALHEGKLRQKEALRLETDAERLLLTDAGKSLALIAQAAELRGGFNKESPAEFNKQFLLAMKAWHNGPAWIATSHTEEVLAAAITSRKDSAMNLVSIGSDNEIHEIDLTHGTSIQALQVDGPAKLKVLETSSDGNWTAIGDDAGTVHVLDLRSNEVRSLAFLCGLETKCEIKRLAFSPDGRFLAAGGNKKSGIHTWELHDDASRWEYHGAVQGHHNRIRTLVFSPRHGHLLLSSDVNGIAQITTVDSLEQIWSHDANGDHSSAAFSQDGERLALVRDKGIVETYRVNDDGSLDWEGQIIVSGTKEIRVIDFYHDTRGGARTTDVIAIGTAEGQIQFHTWNKKLREWISDGELPSFSVGNSGVRMLRFASQNDRLWLLASSIDGMIHWRDVKTATERVFHGKTAWGTAPVLSSEHNFIVGDGGNGVLKLWSINDGHIDVDVSGKAPRHNSDPPRDGDVPPAFCKSDTLKLRADAKGRIIELGTENLSYTEELAGHVDYIEELSFSNDCRVLKSKSRVGIVQQWPLPPAGRDDFAKWLDKRAPYSVKDDAIPPKPLPPLNKLFSEKP